MHITKNSSLISYVEFLEKFQNRSDQGLAYRLIAGGSDLSESDNASNIGQVERRLLRLFQNDFLGLLQIFRLVYNENRVMSITFTSFFVIFLKTLEWHVN